MQRSFLHQLWLSTVFIGFLVLVIAYLPYLLKGFLFFSLAVALLVVIGLIWFRWRFRAQIKSFREQSRNIEDLLNPNARFDTPGQEFDFSQTHSQGRAQAYDRGDGPVIHVQAQELRSDD